MRPTQKCSIMLAMSLVLAAACGGNDDDSSVEASPTTAVRTRPADMTEASASTESRARDETAESAVPATPVAANGEGSTYVTETFLLPFDVTVPGWLPNAPSIDWPNFVTWETTSPADPAVRFLVPVNVYAPGATGPTPPPQDYLAYLLAQTEHGANFADISEVTVGGLPATLMTATTAEHLDGSLGCQAEALTAHECFGLQPDLSLRIAVIDAGDTTLVTWLRHDRVAGSDETTDEFASFEQMLATVQFRDHNERTSVPSTVPAATAIDGMWTTTLTYDELANSPLLVRPGRGERRELGRADVHVRAGSIHDLAEEPEGDVVHFGHVPSRR